MELGSNPNDCLLGNNLAITLVRQKILLVRQLNSNRNVTEAHKFYKIKLMSDIEKIKEKLLDFAELQNDEFSEMYIEACSFHDKAHYINNNRLKELLENK